MNLESAPISVSSYKDNPKLLTGEFYSALTQKLILSKSSQEIAEFFAPFAILADHGNITVLLQGSLVIRDLLLSFLQIHALSLVQLLKLPEFVNLIAEKSSLFEHDLDSLEIDQTSENLEIGLRFLKETIATLALISEIPTCVLNINYEIQKILDGSDEEFTGCKNELELKFLISASPVAAVVFNLIDMISSQDLGIKLVVSTSNEFVYKTLCFVCSTKFKKKLIDLVTFEAGNNCIIIPEPGSNTNLQADLQILMDSNAPEIDSTRYMRFYIMCSVNHWLLCLDKKLDQLNSGDLVKLYLMMLASSKWIPIHKDKNFDIIRSTLLNVVMTYGEVTTRRSVDSLNLKQIFSWKSNNIPLNLDLILDIFHKSNQKNLQEAAQTIQNTSSNATEIKEIQYQNLTEPPSFDTQSQNLTEPQSLETQSQNSTEPQFSEENTEHNVKDEAFIDHLVSWIFQAERDPNQARLKINKTFQEALKSTRLQSNVEFGRIHQLYEEVCRELVTEQEKNETLFENLSESRKIIQQLDTKITELNEQLLEYKNSLFIIQGDSLKDNGAALADKEQLCIECEKLKAELELMKEAYTNASNSAIRLATQNSKLEKQAQKLELIESSQLKDWKTKFGEDIRKGLISQIEYFKSIADLSHNYIKKNTFIQ